MSGPLKSVTVGRLTVSTTKSSDGRWKDANGKILPFFCCLPWKDPEWHGFKIVLGGHQFGVIWL